MGKTRSGGGGFKGPKSGTKSIAGRGQSYGTGGSRLPYATHGSAPQKSTPMGSNAGTAQGGIGKKC